MALTLILNTVLIPLALGLILAALFRFGKLQGGLLALASMAAVLAIYMVLEGIPPLPPVSSKHKIWYIIMGLGVVNVLFGFKHKTPHPILTALLLLASFVWIAYRKISSDIMQPELFLGLIPIAIATVVANAPKRQQQDAFLWPVTLLTAAVAGSLVSVLGSYIGLGQVLGAIAALLGGFLAVVYLAEHILKRPVSEGLVLSSMTWMVTSAMAVILLSIAVFAAKLSALAFALVCLVFLTPFVAPRFIKTTYWWRPFAIGGIALVPAVVAVGTAWVSAN